MRADARGVDEREAEQGHAQQDGTADKEWGTQQAEGPAREPAEQGPDAEAG